jgi:serine/threonine protein kinase
VPLDPNIQHLVGILEAMPLFEGRYERLRHINATRGCFSVVFRAHDRLEGKEVAIKVYSITAENQNQPYRIEGFRREPQILSTLLTRERCLQLVAGLSTFSLQIPVGGGGQHVTIPCDYFVVEWIEEDVDAYFLDHSAHDAIGRLRLFRDICLVVEALHRYEVFHRDLKMDNIRAAQRALRKVVVAIDLGTAARFGSTPLLGAYATAVGHLSYAAPEAIAGLAGNRNIAPKSDLYALGCLLFELFHPGMYIQEFRRRNALFPTILHGMRQYLAGKVTPEEIEDAWSDALRDLARGIVKVELPANGAALPPAISDLVNEVLQHLTAVDFRKRPSLEWARGRISTAVRVLEHEGESRTAVPLSVPHGDSCGWISRGRRMSD